MKSFLEYYNDMHNNIPEESKIFGRWSESIWHDGIYEGHITSYPRSEVLKYLKTFENSGLPVSIIPDDNDAKNIYLLIKISNDVIDDFVTDLSDGLQVYGYFVGKISNPTTDGVYKLLIEPKFPELLTSVEISTAPFYHISNKKYLEKIMKIGLSPRDSTTNFSHPGGRIYLIQTNEKSVIQALKKQLVQSRQNLNNSNPMSPNWEIANMITFKVQIPKNVNVYEDPMFVSGPNHKSVFVTKNIPPVNIKLMNF